MKKSVLNVAFCNTSDGEGKKHMIISIYARNALIKAEHLFQIMMIVTAVKTMMINTLVSK